MPIALLPDRTVVAVSGPDALPFLQGILTCNVETLPEGEARLGDKPPLSSSQSHHANRESPMEAPFDLVLSGGTLVNPSRVRTRSPSCKVSSPATSRRCPRARRGSARC
jgi:hypothetical protein